MGVLAHRVAALARAGPWEMGIAVVAGAYFGNFVIKWEAYYERLAVALLLNKIERNHVRAASACLRRAPHAPHAC